MPLKVPITNPSTSGYVDPHRGFFDGAIATDFLTDSSAALGLEGLRHQVFFFDNIDNTDTWISGIRQIRFVAWQGDRAATDLAFVALTNSAFGILTFTTGGNDRRGWLHVFSGGSG